MITFMKLAFRITALGIAALTVVSCGSSSLSGNNSGSHPSGMGPFDSRGNYVEDWADSPSKWKRGNSKPGKIQEPEIQVEDPPMIAQNEQPPLSSIPLAPTANVTSSPTRPISRPSSSSSSSSSKPVASTVSKPKPKPKPVVAKAKPKAKASSSARYVVKKGDTLSAIARRNKTTVAAIQRANGISGSMIQPGKGLVIP